MRQTTMSHSFDTYKHIKALVAQGMNENQAELVVSTIVESREFDTSKLATKEQLQLIQKDIDHIKETMTSKADLVNETSKIRTDLVNETSKIRTEMSVFREEISKLRTDNNRWMISILIAIIGMIITMVLKS